MVDRFTKERRSWVMSRIRSTGTGIERKMSEALWAAGLKGYRKHSKDVAGKPDFVWHKYKIALFCDSSFWHGHRFTQIKKRLKTNKKYWIEKIGKNIKRDKKYNNELKKQGWHVIRFWDFQIENSISDCIITVAKAIEERKITTE